MKRLQIFTNETITTDVAPGISIDYATRIVREFTGLQEVLGISEVLNVPAGNTINIYKLERYNTPSQVAEGVTIPLTEMKRTVAHSITLGLAKYRKQTTAEAIQKAGRDVAINMTDEALVGEVQADLEGTFYTALATGTGTATGGETLQQTLANLWAAMHNFYKGKRIDPVYFVNPVDAATYLGAAQITTQNAFGFTYVEDFLGLGTVVFSGNITQGEVIATAKQNLIAAIAGGGSDIASAFGLTMDASGAVGMTHTTVTENATIETLIMAGLAFAPELLDGVFTAEIGEESV